MLYISDLGDFSFAMNPILATIWQQFDICETILAWYYNKKEGDNPLFLEQVITIFIICSSNHFGNFVQRTLYIFNILTFGFMTTHTHPFSKSVFR